jgi:hypothetical protein
VLLDSGSGRPVRVQKEMIERLMPSEA